MSRETRCLKVVRSLLQLAYFVYARSESPGEVMHTCRLVGAFATRRCNKNHHLVCWTIYSINFSLRTIIHFFLIQYYNLNSYNFETVSECISRLVSLLFTQINSRCLFLTMAQNYNRYIQVYSCKAFHRWINTPCLTNFYMEMSMGVSLLRTAQSLLTGRTINQGNFST